MKLTGRLIVLVSVSVATPSPAELAAQRLSLTTALDSAFAHHPSLVRARAGEQSAAEGVSTARATRWPVIDAGLGLQRFEEPMITTPIHAFDPSLVPSFDETLVQGTVGLRYTLLDWGARGAGIAAAEAGRGAAVAESRTARMALIQTVADAYLRLVSARAVDAAAEARLAALEEEHARAQRAFAAGTAAEVEVLRASVQMRDAQAGRTTTTGAVHLAERSLSRITGLPTALVAQADLDAPAGIDTPTWPVGEESPGDLSTSPRIEAATRRMESARAVVSGERASRLPRFDLSGAVNDYGTVSDGHVLEWQAGVRLSWAVFAGGARASRIRRAEAELRVAESAVHEVELGVREAVDAARTSIEAADARLAALEASVEQWEELVRIERLALDAGAGTQRDLLEAEAGLFQARAGRTDAQREAVMARIRLAAAQGVLTRQRLTEITGGPE